MNPSRIQARDTCAWGTLPEAARHFGMGVKQLRARAAEGAFPVYDLGSSRRRVKFAEIEAWIRSTRVPVTRHASQRVAEVLAREGRAAG